MEDHDLHQSKPDFHMLVIRSDEVIARIKELREGPKPIDLEKLNLLNQELGEIADQMQVLRPGHKW